MIGEPEYLVKKKKNLLYQYEHFTLMTGFLISSGSKESACNAGGTGEAGLIPGENPIPWRKIAALTSILAWRIPWREKFFGLESTGLQRVRHQLSD